MNPQVQETAKTVSVYTRHSLECPKKDNPQWRRCKCRKWLYIYVDGEDRSRSAKTRSWEEAERQARVIRDSMDSVKQRELELLEREQAAAAEAVTLETALDRWLAAKKDQSKGTAIVYRAVKNKVRSWAERKGFTLLTDISFDALDEWRGLWGLEAICKDERMSTTTQSAFLGHLKQFFQYAVRLHWVQTDPTAFLEAIKVSRKVTLPLTPQQFETLIAATERFDSLQRRDCDKYGCELKALFLLMRWSGLRICDALALPKYALQGNRLAITIQKTKKPITIVIPNHVVSTLQDLRRLPEVHPDYFFWTRKSSSQSLASIWTRKVCRLSETLPLSREDGAPLHFRSHMLRDTFAVEMLLAEVPIEDVSKMLGHSSVKTTEKYYSPWVKARQTQLEQKMIAAFAKMGATVGTSQGAA